MKLVLLFLLAGFCVVICSETMCPETCSPFNEDCCDKITCESNQHIVNVDDCGCAICPKCVCNGTDDGGDDGGDDSGSDTEDKDGAEEK